MPPGKTNLFWKKFFLFYIDKFTLETACKNSSDKDGLSSWFEWQINYLIALMLSLNCNQNRDRCYDHNFLRFLTIFGEKIGVFWFFAID
jgi:hypothetical protein